MSFSFIDPEKLENVEQHIRSIGWLKVDDSVVSVERAGEGNMNCTLRIRLESGSWIIKQARPWVEKYPEIPAPVGRADVEASFYKFTSHYESVSGFMPSLKAFDKASKTLMIQDLGDAQDFTDLYSSDTSRLDILPELCQWLSALHHIQVPRLERENFFNHEMKALNGEHLFYFPLQENNGIDLDNITLGLGILAEELIADVDYVKAVVTLANIYEQEGKQLLHGDFYPGSWLRDLKSKNFWIIDPEFCFMGPAEFDVGILIGHLVLAGTPLNRAIEVFDLYPSLPQFQPELALRFSGVEIMRRLIGVAQLPLDSDIDKKSELLAYSKKLILKPDCIY